MLEHLGDSVLRHSLLGQLTRPLVTALTAFPHASRLELSRRLVKPVAALTTALDQFLRGVLHTRQDRSKAALPEAATATGLDRDDAPLPEDGQRMRRSCIHSVNSSNCLCSCLQFCLW
jgi:hypothetical protein